MDQRYENPVHMAALSMQQQHHHHHSNHVHHQYQNHQYQQMYQDYSDACYHSTPYHEAAYSCDQYGYHPTASVPYGTGIESYLDPKYAANPAAFASRLPYLPFHAAAAAAYGMYDYSFEPAFIRKRNERERQRVKCVNEGYARLREHLPEEYAEKRLSKVETLRGAIMYIKQLQSLLGFDGDKSTAKSKAQPKKASSAESDPEIERCAKKRKLDETSDGENETIVGQGETRMAYPESDKEGMDRGNGRKRALSSCAYESERSNSNIQRNVDDKNDVKLESESAMEECMKPREEFSDNFDAESVFDSCLMSDFPPCFKMGGRAEKAGLVENTQQGVADKELDTSNSRMSTFDFSQCSYEDVISGITLDCNESSDQARGRTGSSQRDSCLRRESPFPNCSRRESNIPEARIPPKYWPEHLLKQAKRGMFSKVDCARQNRYDAYANFATAENFKNAASWGDVHVKSEIQTPPPCLHYDEFNGKADEQHFGLSRGANYCAVSARATRSSFNGACSRPLQHALPNGGQSDGFKSDTSPESSVGPSP